MKIRLTYGQLWESPENDQFIFSMGQGENRIEAIVKIVKIYVTSALVQIVKIIHNGTGAFYEGGQQITVSADYLFIEYLDATQVIADDYPDWVYVWVGEQFYYLRRSRRLNKDSSFCVINDRKLGLIHIRWNNDDVKTNENMDFLGRVAILA